MGWLLSPPGGTGVQGGPAVVLSWSWGGSFWLPGKAFSALLGLWPCLARSCWGCHLAASLPGPLCLLEPHNTDERVSPCHLAEVSGPCHLRFLSRVTVPWLLSCLLEEDLQESDHGSDRTLCPGSLAQGHWVRLSDKSGIWSPRCSRGPWDFLLASKVPRTVPSTDLALCHLTPGTPCEVHVLLLSHNG